MTRARPMRFSLHTGTWHVPGAAVSQENVPDILLHLAGQAGSLAETEAALESWKRAGVCGRVLDIGCGTAQKVKIMSSWPGTVAFGLDMEMRVLSFARRQMHVGRLCAGCGDALPFADGSFDWVTASEVIEHLSNAPAFLREVHRVLAPQGGVLLTTPNRLQYYRPWRPAIFWRALRGQVVVDESHVREFSASELRDQLAQWFEVTDLQFAGTLFGTPFPVGIQQLPRMLQTLWAQGMLLTATKKPVSRQMAA